MVLRIVVACAVIKQCCYCCSGSPTTRVPVAATTNSESVTDCFVELKKNFVLLEKAAIDKDFSMCGTLTK